MAERCAVFAMHSGPAAFLPAGTLWRCVVLFAMRSGSAVFVPADSSVCGSMLLLCVHYIVDLVQCCPIAL